MLQVVAVGGEQHQRAETGRADGVALGDGLGRVADRVERVGRAAHFLRQARHLGDAAGVVGDRAEGIERDDDAGEAEHRRRRDRGAEQAGQRVGAEDAADDDERRQRGRLERDGETLDDVGAVAGDRGLGDRAHRLVADAGVVLGDPDDEAGHREADEAAQEQVQAGDRHAGGRADLAEAAEHVVRRRPQAADRQHGGGEEAAIERAHDRVVGAELDEERADDRGDDAGAADGERIDHQRREVRLAGEEDRAEHHGRDDGHGVGLEQVGRHAGAVADVVADVVGDGRRVARIVLGDAGFDLADEIAADVGALGEDAAAETGEDGDQRGAEAERDERVRHRAVIDGEAEASW